MSKESLCERLAQNAVYMEEQLLDHCKVKFSPILGGHVYRARVAEILGENFHVPLDLATPNDTEEKILRKMRLTEQPMPRIHLHHLLMPDWNVPNASHCSATSFLPADNGASAS